MTLQAVSDFSSFGPEQIDGFAKLLRKSKKKRDVFSEVYRGQSQKPKTAADIGDRVGLTPKQVLEIATPLAASHLFEKTKINGSVAYKKYSNINTVKRKILTLATNQKKLREHVTVRNPGARPHVLKIQLQPRTKDLQIRVTHITVDDIDNFSRVRSLPASEVPDELTPARLPEAEFKMGTARIMGNRGTFKDWGGEKNDLYTSNVKIRGKRYAAAFGFKGPGKSGKLTPGKMGKNGDQIQRLFSSTAQVLIVQYEGEIAESVVEQMQKLAVSKSIEENQQIYYGVIALEDSYRLRLKYKKQFQAAAGA